MRSWVAAALAVAGATSVACAEDVKLPKQISWTAYGTTSSGYSQSVGLGNMLKSKYDVDLRIIPGNNDVSRMLPLKAGQAEICACGIASYFGQEGVFMFADRKFGPMPLYNLFNNIGRNGGGLIVAGDLGVKSYADLKGKRVTWVRGSPALNLNSTAVLAFADLSWADVVRVDVPGWGQSMQAIIDGQADAAYGSTISSVYNQMAASPRSIIHLPFPHDDEAAWERAQSIAPHWSKGTITNAVAIENNPSGKKEFEGVTFPYPIFVSMPDVSDELAYGLTKAIMENYESYKESGPGMDGYQISRQNLSWIFPYHPGSIRYYEEIGKWTAENQASTDAALKRNEVLTAAWEKFIGTDVSDDEFEEKWLAARADALEEAAMPVPFAEPLGD
jgi:TRAP transporter TAXI family solute receptor